MAQNINTLSSSFKFCAKEVSTMFKTQYTGVCDWEKHQNGSFLCLIADLASQIHRSKCAARWPSNQSVRFAVGRLGFDSLVESHQRLKKMLFTASTFDAQRENDGKQKNPTSLLDGSMRKALNGTHLSLWGRKIVGPSSIFSWWPRFD